MLAARMGGARARRGPWSNLANARSVAKAQCNQNSSLQSSSLDDSFISWIVLPFAGPDNLVPKSL